MELDIDRRDWTDIRSFIFDVRDNTRQQTATLAKY